MKLDENDNLREDPIRILFFNHMSLCHTDRFGVGQNVYNRMSSDAFPTADWNTAIKSWYEEVQFMTASNHEKFAE